MRGSTELDNWEYDEWLSKQGNEKELRLRNRERKGANDGIKGWHFGIDDKPVYAKDKKDYLKKLDKRGLTLEGEL